jgi:hypothetical protein
MIMDPGFKQKRLFAALLIIVVLSVGTSCNDGGNDGRNGGNNNIPLLSPLWGTAELIEDDNAGDAYGPQIAVDDAGNAIAVWHQYDGIRYNIWTNRFDGAVWGTAELIETDDTGDAYDPQIAVDSAGNAIAVWYQDDGIRFNIWTNRFDGAAWGAAELIETDDTGEAYDPQIAVDGAGNAIAVWDQYDGIRFNIWTNRFDGAAWGTAELIETDKAGDAYWPQIAVDGAGNAIAVWNQNDGIRFNIWANRFDGVAWGTAELIGTDNTGDAYGPQIAADGAGNAMAVWYQYDSIGYSTRSDIWANHFDGAAWGTAELIETHDAGSAYGPQIAMDGAGGAIAVWDQYDGIRSNICINCFNGASWGTTELIETDNAGGAMDPQIVIDGNGNAIAVWRQWDGTRISIWANRYDSAA